MFYPFLQLTGVTKKGGDANSAIMNMLAGQNKMLAAMHRDLLKMNTRVARVEGRAPAAPAAAAPGPVVAAPPVATFDTNWPSFWANERRGEGKALKHMFTCMKTNVFDL